jgi:hypothetical protein
MVDHVVLYRLRPDVKPKELTAVSDLIHALAEQIPGIVSVESGDNIAPPEYNDGYGWGFVVRFAGVQERDRYYEHPAHLAIVPAVEAVTTDVLVFDLDLDAVGD